MGEKWGTVLLLGIIFGMNLSMAKELTSALFIFGDSTLDVGTNSNLKESLARADMPFYGIDFPYSKPTGRFSNGYNTADYLAKLLMGYAKSPSPYLTLIKCMPKFKSSILGGVNFASAGSGILDNTGITLFKAVIPLGMQIQQFAAVRSNITEVLGAVKAAAVISNSLFIISTGSNDLFDYQGYQRSHNGSSSDLLINMLHSTYSNHMKNLYNLGARKFGIVSIPPIGCTPFQRFLNGSGGCFEELNTLALSFYASTVKLLQDFSKQFPGVKFSLGNAYAMTMSIIDNPLTFRMIPILILCHVGFDDVQTACCGTGKFNGETQCNKTAKLCSDRSRRLFWDLYHPTQVATELAAVTLYGGGLEFVMPMNFSQLNVPNAY